VLKTLRPRLIRVPCQYRPTIAPALTLVGGRAAGRSDYLGYLSGMVLSLLVLIVGALLS
jgi:hypothetical protein